MGLPSRSLTLSPFSRGRLGHGRRIEVAFGPRRTAEQQSGRDGEAGKEGTHHVGHLSGWTVPILGAGH
jgi:hypothetical protein